VGSLFDIVAEGRLAHDGDMLRLKGAVQASDRIITDDEVAGIKLVTPENRIPQCRGYELFLIVESGGS
jgi:hypothetical protein